MINKDMDARKEQGFLYQILEEHMEKDKKHYQPCQDCIRLGLNKGYNFAKEKIFENLSHAVCYGINGHVTEEELDKIKKYLKKFAKLNKGVKK